MNLDPIIVSLVPLLFIVLIFLSYLNVLESSRTKKIYEKMEIMSNYMKIVAEKLNEGSEKVN